MCWGDVGGSSFFYFQICGVQKRGWCPLHGSHVLTATAAAPFPAPHSTPEASPAHPRTSPWCWRWEEGAVRHTSEAPSAGGALSPHPAHPAGAWLPPWLALKSSIRTNVLRHNLTSQEALGHLSPDVCVWRSTLRGLWGDRPLWTPERRTFTMWVLFQPHPKGRLSQCGC